MNLLKSSPFGIGSEVGPPGSGLLELEQRLAYFKEEQARPVYSPEYCKDLHQGEIETAMKINRTYAEMARHEAKELRNAQPKESIFARLGRVVRNNVQGV